MSFSGPPVSNHRIRRFFFFSSEATGSDFLRSRISTTLTGIRCNQVEKADSPRKGPNLAEQLQKSFPLHQVFRIGRLFTMRRHKA